MISYTPFEEIDVQGTRDSQVGWLFENSDPANDLAPSSECYGC